MKIVHSKFGRATIILLLAQILASNAVAELNVVASIRPIHSLVAAVMDEAGEPGLLINGGESPHSFSLKPSQARLLQNADLVFWIGQGLETFMDKAQTSIASKGTSVPLIETVGLNQIDFHHDAPTTDDGHEQETEGHEHEEGHDPHIWLDPQNAIVLVGEISRVLVDADPENGPIYNKNASNLTKRLEALLEETRRKLQHIGDNGFMVFHDAYGHFEYRFGLKSAGALYLNPEVMPGAGRRHAIVEKIASSGVECLFSEPQSDQKAWSFIAETTDVHFGTLDPVGQELPIGPDLYFQLIRDMAEAFYSCLQP